MSISVRLAAPDDVPAMSRLLTASIVGWQFDGPQASGRVVNGYPMRKVLTD